MSRHGWSWDYGGVPWWTARFWTSLALLDPLAAVLLFLKPRLGVVATWAIMFVDVPVNVWTVARHGGAVWMVASQAAFLVLVLATTRWAWAER